MSQLKQLIGEEAYAAKLRAARGCTVFGIPLDSLETEDLLVAFVFNQEIMKSRLDSAERARAFHADLLSDNPTQLFRSST